jgi:1,4-alpha-glucan branching enzyme
MRVRYPAGVWELFVPRIGPGSRYKYDIIGPIGARVQKADPVAQQTEPPPATASVVAAPDRFRWHDEAWMASRAGRHAPHAPISIYEVHLGSWIRHHERGHEQAWDEAIGRLLPYVADMGFTHVEFLPITEYPFGGSWATSHSDFSRRARALWLARRFCAFRRCPCTAPASASS